MAPLRENSLFGVLSLLTGQRSDRFYHAGLHQSDGDSAGDISKGGD